MKHSFPVSAEHVQRLSGIAGLYDLQAAERGANPMRTFLRQSLPLLAPDAPVPDYETADFVKAGRMASNVMAHLAEVTKAYLGLPHKLSEAELYQLEQEVAELAPTNVRDAFKLVLGYDPGPNKSVAVIGAPEPLGLIYHFFQLDGLYDNALQRYSDALVQDPTERPNITSLSVGRTPEELGHAYAFYRAMQIREAYPQVLNGADQAQVMAAVRAKPPTDYLVPRDVSRYC